MSTQLSSQKRSLRLVPIALAGAALAAALVTSLVMHLQPETSAAEQPRTPVPVAPAAHRPYGPPTESPATTARLLALEQRMMELAARPTPAPQATQDEAPAEESPPPAPVDLKAQQLQAHEAFEQRVVAALREPADVIWSSRTAHTIQGELRSLRGESQFQVSKIDCRSSACVAELSFPNQNEALTHIARLVINMNLEGCGSAGHIDPSDEPMNPSRMRMLFDCSRTRQAR